MPMNNWMSTLPDNLSISDIAIPGTHDSATYIAGIMGYGTLAALIGGVPLAGAGLSVGQAFLQCQSADFPAQFGMGIRFLDIRARVFNGSVVLCHGSVPLFRPLSLPFEAANDFLKANPRETIILCVKNDGDGADSGKIFSEIHRLAKQYNCYTGCSVPTLGAVRGRIMLVNRIHAEKNGGIHFDFPGNAIDTRRTKQADGTHIAFIAQDVYDPDTAFFDSTLTNKREAIERGYKTTGQADFRFAFMSASTFPTRTPGNYASNINKHVWRYLGDWAGAARWITVLDYVGDYGTGADSCIAAVVGGNDFSGGVKQRNILAAGETLKPGDALHSPNKTYQAIFQSDGNFVIYRLCDGYVMGAGGTNGKGATRAVLQADGNFVIYAGDKALYATGTDKSGTVCRLEMQNDGNLVLYNAKGKAQWASRSKGF